MTKLERYSKMLLMSCLMMAAIAVGAAQLTFYSSTASVGTTSTTLIAANSGYQSVTIQNTHASQSLYLSFNCPATTSDLVIPAGASVNFNPAPTNTLCAVASGASTTVTITGGKL